MREQNSKFNVQSSKYNISRLTSYVLFLMFLVTACSPKASQVKPAEPVQALSISRLEIGKADSGSVLSINATGPLNGNYTVIKVAEPPMVVIEMPGVDVGKFEGTIDAANGVITKVVTSRLNGSGVRMEVVLSSLVEHEVKAERDMIELSFAGTPVAEAPQAKAEEPAKVEAEEAAQEKAQSPEGTVEEPKIEERAEGSKKSIKVKAVEIKKTGKFTKAEIITDGEVSDYNVFELKSPARVVVDVRNAREISSKKDIKAVSTHIKGVRLGRHDGQVRVVFDYKGSIIPYEVVKGKDRISILFGKKPATVVAKVERAAAKEEVPKGKEEEKVEVEVEKKPEMAAAVEPVPAIEAMPEAKVEEKVEAPIAKTEASAAEVKEEVKAEKSEAPKAEVKEEVKVKTESKAEAPKEEAKAKVVTDINEKVVEEVKAEEKAAAKEKAASVPVVEAKVEEKAEPEAEKKTGAEGESVELAKVYNGQKVTLEFKDADIKNIFRIIAEVSGYNMIIDNAVAGKVTIRLVNVPWDQALDILLETNSLGMKKVGNVIRVLPAATIKKEDDDKLASKKAKEKLEDLVTESIFVNYAKASDLSSKLKSVMTDRGTILVDERTSTIILKDIQKSVDAAKELLSRLDERTPQVVIEARIVTANTNFARDLGVQWGTGYAGDAAHGNPTGYYFPNSYNVTAGGGGAPLAVNLPASGGVGSGPSGGGVVGINFGSINNTFNLDLRLSALESQGWGKVVSSPKIITLDNKEASIQQGISIPFETTSASGTQTTFVDANLNLTVTPHVTADRKSVSMVIKVSKNRPDLSFKGASGAPSIDKKEAKTELLVKDGDTTVIGGIYEIDKSEKEFYTPFLGRIPIIGWLFKSKSKSETKQELLIFITPKISRGEPVS